jgi:hypothetical protein
MMAAARLQDLADRLPVIRGRYSFDVDLSRTTWSSNPPTSTISRTS